MSYRYVRTDDELWVISMRVSLAILGGDYLKVVPVAGCDPLDVVSVQQKVEHDADGHGQWVSWNGSTAEFTTKVPRWSVAA